MNRKIAHRKKAIRQLLYHIALIVLLLGISTISEASYFVSVGSGNWDDLSAWEQDSTTTPALRSPQGGDTIIIKAGHTITINNQYDFTGQGAMYIQIEGILRFATGKKLKMDAGSGVKLVDAGSIVIPGTGGGSSNIIEIGGATLWNSGDGPLSGPSDLGTTPTYPLPVTWVFVDIEKSENKNVILWGTSFEEHTSHFEIERSNNLRIWEVIGETGQDLSGNYSFVDSNPKKGINYYRVKHVELDNIHTHSKIVSIFNEIEGFDISIFPNPTSDYLKVRGIDSGEFNISVLDSKGSIIRVTTEKIFDEIIVDLNTLNSGMFLIKVQSPSGQKTLPFIKN